MKSNFTKSTALVLSSALLLAGCATQPMGPTVQVMPAVNKPFQMFQQEQAECKGYAQAQVQGQADSANNKAVGSALLGAALGAGLGAAVGGGRGAGVGAAAGGVVGTSVGADGANNAQQSIQVQYDNAYGTCMYSKGNQVAGLAPALTAALPPPPPPPPGAMAPPNTAVPPPNAPPPPR
jgi:outer membrane lipoprotein SlyB